MKYIGPNISFIFTKIKELMNSHNTDNSAHSELFKSWKRLRNPNNADIADALAATYKNGIGDVLVEVKDDTTFALEDIKLFFRPASFKLISANDSLYEGIYITMDGTQGRYVAETFADSEIMTPEGPSTISTPSTLVLYPAASDAVTYTPQTLTDEQQTQARDNIGAGQPVFVVNVTSTVDNNYTADKTAAEIEAAYQAGRTIVCKTQMPISIGYIPVELPLVSRNQERAVFGFAVDLVQDNFIFAITVDISDSRVLVSNNMAEIYEKPASGIPKSDLEQSVQTSLDKADTAISYTPQTLTEEQQEQARTNIGALDENIHTTEVDVKRTLNGIGTNLFYVRKGWLKPCPDDANDELINSYTTAVLFLNFISLTVDSVKRHAKGAYTIYQQGLASANLQFTDNPLDVERYISWDITTNNNKTYLTYQHYGHNGFSETCRYCVEDDSYDNVRVVNALNTRQTGDNPNATANQFYLATNPTKDMHIATKQYVDTAKTEAQQLGLTTATPGKTIKVKTVQDGKPTEWEAVDMPSQPDWNQNDNTKPDYIKNRPFYTGNPVETVLVEESTVTFAENEGLYMAQFQSTFSATVGETYKVSWDGAAYECTCVSFNGAHAIGNLSIVSAGSDTGEPFLMGVRNGEAIQIVTADTSASHTFSISGVVSVVKIDAKYLPNTVATKSDVEAAQTTADDAQTTADNAWTRANNAWTTANNAQTTANNAQTTANAALPKAGGTMTGSLVLKGDPTAKMEAATKQYVDANKFTGEYRRRSDNKIVAIDNFSYTDNVAQFYCRATINQGTTRCDYYLGLHGKANLSILCLQDGHIQIGVSCGVANAEQNIVFTNDNKTAGYGGVNISGIEGITMFSSSSSGPGRKKFRITVDDNGVPTITDESDSTNTWKAADLYEKPTSGIPKTDLADDVQTSLAKADTAISYNSQTLTDAQKQQARTNIGAVKCSVSGNRLILTT